MRPAALALSLAFVAGSIESARADKPGADWLAAEQVITKVKASGYAVIGKIEADNGGWEGEGLKNGRWMDVHADPRTGAVTSRGSTELAHLAERRYGALAGRSAWPAGIVPAPRTPREPFRRTGPDRRGRLRRGRFRHASAPSAFASAYPPLRAGRARAPWRSGASRDRTRERPEAARRATSERP